ncbi:penicillin-binding protein activator [Thalassotalea fusca]
MSLIKFKTSFSSLICSLFCVLIISSCATPKKSVSPSASKSPTDNAVTTENADYYLALAQQESTQQNLANSIAAMTSATTHLIKEGRLHQGIWLSKQTLAIAKLPSQRMTLHLNIAKGLFLTGQTEAAYDALVATERLNKESSVSLPADYFQLKADVLITLEQSVLAIDAQLRAFALSISANEQDIEQLWQQISPLAQWEMTKLAKLSPPYIDGWQALYHYANRYGHNSALLSQYLTQWQREYPAHPAQALLPNFASNMATPQPINKIAVILPLSGNQQRAGKVAQQGILAAFEQKPERQITFIDSAQLDIATLPQLLAEKEIEFVIGPLLKHNVDHYQQLEELTIPTLFLNLPSTLPLAPHHTAISMRPEDEAIQAANTLSQRGFKSPLVISHKDPVMQRIASTFVNHWAHITGTKPDLIYIDSSADMQKALKESLEINDSEARIKAIDSRVNQNIKFEKRNRRDVDMAYLIGSPTETRLMKPFIDVNTSTFSETIPVFASSRSHSIHADSSDTRDLEGLVFTEMPWLLASSQQNTALLALTQQLWPDRSDSLQRIFAMGYDSYQLVDKLPAMQANSYVRHYGQTGVLKLNTQNILTRSLIWGRYSRSNVQETDME